MGPAEQFVGGSAIKSFNSFKIFHQHFNFQICFFNAYDFQRFASSSCGTRGLFRDYVHNGVHLKYSDMYDCDAGSLVAVSINDDQSHDFTSSRYVMI